MTIQRRQVTCTIRLQADQFSHGDVTMENVSYLAAFAAGVLCFTSPCSLPIVPLYMSYLVGSTDKAAQSRRPMMTSAVAFVIGFSLIFVLVGTAFGVLGTLLSSRKSLLVQVGGLMLILLGLHQIGVVRIPFLSRSHGITPGIRARASVVKSSLVGMTFAAGWTPCAGPILGAILTLALSQGGAGHAAILLSLYSLGHGIPFLLIAFAGSSSRWIRSISARSASVDSFSGAVMLAVGLIMVLGIYQRFFARLVGLTPWAPIESSLT